MATQTSSDRRAFLAGIGGLALGGSTMIARPALAADRTVTFTLPWLAQGNSLFTYVGRAKGFFSKRGIKLEISRGFGSLAAAQAVGNGKFDFGMMLSTPLILTAAQGLPIVSVAMLDYESSMGVGVDARSSLKSVSDLAGKRIAGVPASGEFPFFPAFARLSGLDPASVQIVNVDPKILERTLSERQVEAITGVGTAQIPVLIAQKTPVRWFLYSSAGMRTYGQTIGTRPDLVTKEPALVGDVVGALLESLAFSLRNPDEAMDIFVKELPEMALNPGAREFLRLGLGFAHLCTCKAEPREHGLGWSDPAVCKQMNDLVVRYGGLPDLKPPPADVLFTNRFVGGETLTPAEWTAVGTRVAEFAKLMT